MAITSTLERTPPPLPGKTVDNTLPTVGGNLAVVTDSETSSGFTISWDKGSDNQTAEAQLRYLVYISTQDNITGVSNAENNGTLLNPNEQDQLDINTYQVTEQNAETQYWSTVILKDQGGNKAAYGVVTETTAVAGSGGLDTRAGDETFMQDLYTATNGASWTTNTGWNDGAMSLSDSPYGLVIGDPGTGEDRILEVNLENNNLDGNLPTSIENLKYCTVFDVETNLMVGDIPTEIGNMTRVEELWLAGRYDEDIPGSYFYHPGKVIDVTNRYTGTFPQSISNLTNLRILRLERQGQMTGQLPTDMGNLVNLEHWMMTGEFREDDVQTSGLTGTVPASIGSCVNLLNFQIGRNAIEGQLPIEMRNLVNLVNLWFEATNIEGPLHEEFIEMQSIRFLFAGDTMNSGDFPTWWFEEGAPPNWNTFDFSGPKRQPDGTRGFTGNLSDFSGAPGLNHFDIDGNSVTGPMPSGIQNNINPEIFSIGWPDNEGLSGEMEATGWDNWKNNGSGNRFVRLHANSLSGAMPSELPKMEELFLSDNEWTSATPQAFIDVAQHIRYNRDVSIAESINISSNRLTPVHFVPAIDDVVAEGVSFSYSNQRDFDEAQTLTPNSGTDVTLDKSDHDLASNSYQWTKDGVAISGETSHTLSLTSVDASDDGEYRLEIQSGHADVSQTFTSRPITIEVQ